MVPQSADCACARVRVLATQESLPCAHAGPAIAALREVMAWAKEGALCAGNAVIPTPQSYAALPPRGRPGSMGARHRQPPVSPRRAAHLGSGCGGDSTRVGVLSALGPSALLPGSCSCGSITIITVLERSRVHGRQTPSLLLACKEHNHGSSSKCCSRSRAVPCAADAGPGASQRCGCALPRGSWCQRRASRWPFPDPAELCALNALQALHTLARAALINGATRSLRSRQPF